MKNFLFCSLLALATAVPASAQTFTLGARYSSYSTDITTDLASFETGREGSIGISGTYRAGGLVLNGAYDSGSGWSAYET
jgi:hypothetical protein